MKLHPFAATALSLLGIVVVSPAYAQDAPSPSDPKPAESQKPSDAPTTPPASQDAPKSDVPQAPTPPSDQAPPAPMPVQEPPPVAPPPQGAPGATPGVSPDAANEAMNLDGFESFVAPPRDKVPTVIGEKLSPLLITGGFGIGYAAIDHPQIASTSLTGSFAEITAGTELDHRFRLSFSFTSFQSTVHRTRSGWMEGDYPVKVAGLQSQADPVEPRDAFGNVGGVEVQKTLHIHSIAPRIDFLPLGSQGPYIGATLGLGVIQDIGLRAGGDASLRVGGEWRPYHVFGLGVEAGAHGQLYVDAKTAIPYATARLQFYLDPEQLSTKRSPTTRTFVPTQQRTLPMPGSGR